MVFDLVCFQLVGLMVCTLWGIDNLRLLLLSRELAKRIAMAGILRWPIKPKHHVTFLIWIVCLFLFSLSLFIFHLAMLEVTCCLKSLDLKGWRRTNLSLFSGSGVSKICWIQKCELYNARFVTPTSMKMQLAPIKGLRRRVHGALLEL